jgi:hypothetical protein
VVGTRSGHVVLWRQQLPSNYQPQEGHLPSDSWSCLGVTRVTGSQVTSLAWCVVPATAAANDGDTGDGGGGLGAGRCMGGAAAKAMLAGVMHEGDHLVLATGESVVEIP